MRYGSLITIALIAGLGAAGLYWQKSRAMTAPVKGETAGARPDGRRGAQRPTLVPVAIDTVRTETVPVYREGIGNVQSLAAVIVRPQIDGRLMSVDFAEGQDVKKGDVLARIDATIYQAQYDQALAKRSLDQATLANARVDLQRYQRLAQSNAGPKQQADQQGALVAQLEAQVKSDDAAIDNAKAVLGYTIIAAPIDGRLGLRTVDPGNIVKSGDVNGLVSVTQVSPIAATFTLPQRDLPAISAALTRSKAAVEILESGSKNVLARGVLQTIDNQIDVSTGTIKLKAVFPNEDQKLWPGQFVSTRVVVDMLVDAKAVAATAIRRGPLGTFVFLINAEDKALIRPVTIVMQDENRAIIGTGIEPGDRVVTAGFAQLSEGSAVQVTGPAPTTTPATTPAVAAPASAKGEAERKREPSADSEPRTKRRDGSVRAERKKSDAKETTQ